MRKSGWREERDRTKERNGPGGNKRAKKASCEKQPAKRGDPDEDTSSRAPFSRFPSLSPSPLHVSRNLRHGETPTSWPIHDHFTPRFGAQRIRKKPSRHRESGKKEWKTGVGGERVDLPNLVGNVPSRINELQRDTTV